MSTERCGYTLVDAKGEQYPCDRPALSWRWYQNVEHEDSLDEACELHENEGGRRMAQQTKQIAAVLALHQAREEGDGSRTDPWCAECDGVLPCETLRALGVTA